MCKFKSLFYRANCTTGTNNDVSFNFTSHKYLLIKINLCLAYEAIKRISKILITSMLLASSDPQQRLEQDLQMFHMRATPKNYLDRYTPFCFLTGIPFLNFGKCSIYPKIFLFYVSLSPNRAEIYTKKTLKHCRN